MADRAYRSVADPAGLGTLERAQGTGRRHAERSDKARSTPRPLAAPPSPPRRALVVAGVILAVLVVGGGVAALASRGGESSGSSDPSDASAAAPNGSEGGSAAGAGGEDLGTFSGTAIVSEVVDRNPFPGVGSPPYAVGDSTEFEFQLRCDGSSCRTVEGVVPPGLTELTLDGDVLRGEERYPEDSPPGCPPQETVFTAELAIGADGALSGTSTLDLVPGVVWCTAEVGPDVPRYGSKVTYEISGQTPG